MKTWKGKWIAGAMATAVLFGGLGGLTHQAFADDDSSDGSTASESSAPAMPVKKQVGHELKAIIPSAAELLSLSPETVNSELKNGKSLTEIASQRGLHASEVKEKLVKSLEQPVDQALSEHSISSKDAAKLKQKITDEVQRAFSTAGYQEQESDQAAKGHALRIGYTPKLERLATVLGVNKKQLKQALQDGQSIAEFAASKGIGEEQLVAKLKEELTPSIQDFIQKK
ncbi:hypothetical protein ACFQI7_24700 [Paenibacillus allorhizosphaerae]|uniref:Helix-turn-helix domain-containing protein n=1 Tax=Paenibacillus allorhizosphaerae TaxID=2849866 RepID=A0ABM8VTL9_9BACL|nr:hypothetical protein [Paenibacillus allorhizosphaerae]CAG7657745.1 hypothetical protein PAECIP111802_06848 [Paenibacillus allorhizosphaerae]